MRTKRPKPTYLKLVKPATGKKKVSPNPADWNEPIPLRGDLPMPPPELSDDAKVEWGRVSSELYRLGLLTIIDRAVLAAYCQAYGRWMQAERAITEMAKRDLLTGALMIKTAAGNAIHNPLVSIANKAMADMARYAVEFGMTPSARSTLKADPKSKDGDPAARFLG
jgi:P27 family predicted phage terminase small subunit